MEAGEVHGGEERGRVRLFGVTICGGCAAEETEGGGGADVGEEMLRKSKSMSNLASAEPAAENGGGDRGYLSDGGLRKSGKRPRRKAGAAGHERKKGIPWTEEEHRTFLEGLEKLGKGDWRGISRKFVTSRTPTQVASHAQKYFIRQSIPTKKKRRSSLFDVVINDATCRFETVPTASSIEPQKESNETHLMCRENKKVGASDSKSAQAPFLGPRRPTSSLLTDFGGVPEPSSFNCMEGASGLIEGKPASIEPIIPQTPSPVLDVGQSAASSEMHRNQATFGGEFKLFPCHPSQGNTRHQAAEGNDLELRIGPPKLLTRSEVPPRNAVGAIRVV